MPPGGQLQGFIEALIWHEGADRAKGLDVVHAVGRQGLAAQQQGRLKESALIHSGPHRSEVLTATKHQFRVLAKERHAIGHIGLLRVRSQRAHAHPFDRGIAHHDLGQSCSQLLGHSIQVLGRHDAKPVHPKATDSTDALHAARAAEVTSLWRLGPLR